MAAVAKTASPGLDAGLARNWWAVGLRGFLAVAFGLAVLALPPPTLASLIVWFAAYLAADGVFALVAATWAARRGERSLLLIYEGATNLAVGGGVLAWNAIAIAPFFQLASIWAVVSGALLLAAARRLPELGVNFIDTADAYGPHVSEMLIREALHPYEGLTIATKGGLVRTGPDQWRPVGRPEYLREAVLMSMRRLGVDRIDLWQLHRIDPKVPREEQFDAVRGVIKEGLIRYAGLSNVTIPEIEAAQLFFEVVSVQNRYNLVDRSSQDVLVHCEAEAMGFIPWYPLAAGSLAKPGSILESMASKYRATPSQIALAWLLKRGENVIPIPGTAKVTHLEENVAACAVELSDRDFDLLDREGWKAWRSAA